MALWTAGRSRLRATLGLTAGLALLGLAILPGDGSFPTGLVQRSYDLLHSLSPVSAAREMPVVIVYLDGLSYEALGQDPLKRWPRELHAQLVRRLRRAGARAIVFDIIFDAPSDNAAADEQLAAAIRESGCVILAAEHNDKATHKTSEGEVWTRATSFRMPYKPFADAAAGWGVASLAIADDLEVRRFLAGFPESDRPSLVWATGQFLQLPDMTNVLRMKQANSRWIRYYGPSLTIPHVSISEALEANGVPDSYFKNKIVLVGARPMESSMNERRDEFRNPFHSWSNKEFFMPGVEVHATEIANLLNAEWLRRLQPGSEAAALVVAALLLGGLVWLRPIPATGAALACAGAALGLSIFSFSHGVWFPWLIVSAVQVPAALGGSVLFHSIEWYRTRRRYEARLRQQAALIDKAHDAILVQSLEGKITYANPSAERLYGWSLIELQTARPAEELFSLDAETLREARAATLQKGEWNGELHLQTRSGETLIVASRWTLIQDRNGEARELLLINSDITEQKKLEQQFLRSQRMNTIGTLAGGMAHDLNNALAPILMGTQLLRRNTTDPQARDVLSVIESSTHRSADMVRQVLLFARGRGGEVERLDLTNAIAELEKLLRETFPKNVSIETFVPRDLWPVTGNLTQIHQVLLNLSVNARDAMPQGGKLSIIADNLELTAVEASLISGARAGHFVSILVSDTGSGMPPEVQARIFEPFFSTKGLGQGTGIGLSTVVRIVQAHEGFLRVQSELGKGTSFEMFLPRASMPAKAESPPAKVEQHRGNGELILLVDDEKAIRELVASELNAFGYTVRAASGGQEAIAFLREHLDKVRVLMTDSSMPALSGAELITLSRQIRPKLPVIIMSGENPNEPISNSIMLNKPFTLDELLAALQSSLRT